MTKGHEYNISAMREQKKPLDPIWTGIGCIMVALFLAAGYFIGDWFLQANDENLWIVIPSEFAWPPFAPYASFKIIIAVMVTTIGTTLTSILYAIFNPPKPGKYDITDPDQLPPVFSNRGRR